MDATRRTVLRNRLFDERFETDRLIETPGTAYSSPSRKAKKPVSYAESDEDEDEGLKPSSGNRRASKRRRISVKDDDSDDEFGLDAGTQAAMLESDQGMFWSAALPVLLTSYD